MTGKLLCLSAPLVAVLCFAPASRAQQAPEQPGLDPSWTDEEESEPETGAQPDGERSPLPSQPPPPVPSPLPTPSPWVSSEPWFRVELGGDDRQLWFQISSLAKGADKKVPIHACASPCRVLLPRGEYRVHVSGNPERVEGDRKIELTADTSLRFSLPDRSARTTGLVLGITGSSLVGVGMVVLLFSGLGAVRGSDDHTTRTGAYVGGAIVITGAVLTPIGWAQFARNRKPRVEQRPLGAAPSAATASSFRIGMAPVAGGAAAGMSFNF